MVGVRVEQAIPFKIMVKIMIKIINLGISFRKAKDYAENSDDLETHKIGCEEWKGTLRSILR